MLNIGPTYLFKNRIIWYFLLFLAVFSYFLWLNASPGFADADAFYHAKVAAHIRDQGLIKNFTWLPQTALAHSYIDHQLLYHILLIPFITFFPPLAAMKISAALFAALALVVFQLVLDKCAIRHSFLFTLLILSSNQFIFRLNLAKTVSLSIVFILLFLYWFIFANSPTRRGMFLHGTLLFIIGFLYVWLYGGWIILLAVVLISLIVKGGYQKFASGHGRGLGIMNYELWDFIRKIIFSAGGIITGLALNPYFPTNLKFYWQQAIQVGLVNLKQSVDVGGEWYGSNWANFISANVLVLMVSVLAVTVLLLHLTKSRPAHWILLLLAAAFLVMTLKSRRYVEYFVPLAVLFSAFSFNLEGGFKEVKLWCRNFIDRNRILARLAFVGLVVVVVITVVSNTMSLKPALAGAYRFDQFRDLAGWITQHAPKGEIIFHDNWSDWPLLFYWNPDKRYVIGLDPSFLYLQDKQRYFLWRDLVSGKITSPCAAIAREFESRYIIIKKENDEFRLQVEKDGACERAYEDEDGFVYEIANF